MPPPTVNAAGAAPAAKEVATAGERGSQDRLPRGAVMSDESTAGGTWPASGAGSHDSHHSDPGVNALTSFTRSDVAALESLSNGRRQSEAQIASKQHLTSTPEEHGDTQCGLGSWRPSWLQRLASKKAY
ncbi:Protein of unknown function, partial [Gryllus bimaculatus]